MRFCRKFIRTLCTWKENSLRHVSFDATIPVFTVPILLFIASQNLICTILVFLISPLLIFYLYRNFLRFLMRTKFFLMWTVTSVVILMLVFELSVVPLLEILPEENLVFMICVVGGLICGYRTRQKSEQMSNQENLLQQELELGKEAGNICNRCSIRTLSSTIHCRLCQACIIGREYHCKWLDCCIGKDNLRWYMMCLFFSAAAFIYGSNLTMTSVCHPFILIGTVLLPDDCSDVYYELDMAICFVSSVYSLLIGLIVFFYFTYHIWLLCFGTVDGMCLRNNKNPHNKGILKNTVQIICCKS